MKKLLCLLTVIFAVVLLAEPAENFPVLPQANGLLIVNVAALQGTLLGNLFPQAMKQLAEKQLGDDKDDDSSKFLTSLQKLLASQGQDSLLPLKQMAVSFVSKEDIDDSQVFCVCTLKQPMDKQALLATIKQQVSAEITTTEIPQGTRLDLKFGEGDDSIVSIVLPAPAQTLLTGDKKSVDAVLAAKNTAIQPSLMAAFKLLPQDAPVRLVNVFPPDQQSPIAKIVADRSLEETPIGMSLNNATGLAISLDSKADEFGYRQLLLFSNAEDAQQTKNIILDGMLLGMGKMSIQQSLGQSIPLLDSMTTAVHDNAAEFACRCTPADIDALKTLFLQFQAQQQEE